MEFFEYEKLKKDIWFLKQQLLSLSKKVDAMSGGKELDELKSQVQSLQNSLTTLSSQIDELSTTSSDTIKNLETFKGDLSTLNSTVETLLTDFDSLKGDYDTLSETVSGYNNVIKALQDRMTTVVNTLNEHTKTLTNHLGRIEEIDLSISSIKDKQTTFDSSLAAHDKKFADIQTAQKSQDDKIAKNEDGIVALQNLHAALESKVKDLGLEEELIYDMRSTDEKINQGFTTGLHGSSNIVFPITNYKYLRIFATLNNMDSQLVVKIAERNKMDFTMMSAHTSMKSFHFFKVQTTPAVDRLLIGYYAILSYNSTSKTFALEYGAKHDNFFVYRIEGLK